MSAVVDSGWNSRFFRRLWAGREGLWPGLDTLVSYSCEKSSRSGSDACGQNHRRERERMRQACRWSAWVTACDVYSHREKAWSCVCSYEEVWRHLNVSNPLRTLNHIWGVFLASSCTIYSSSSKPAAQRLFLVCLRSFYSCQWTICEWMGTFFKEMCLKKEPVREERTEDRLVFITHSYEDITDIRRRTFICIFTHPHLEINSIFCCWCTWLIDLSPLKKNIMIYYDHIWLNWYSISNLILYIQYI